jgi:hypothetical protein
MLVNSGGGKFIEHDARYHLDILSISLAQIADIEQAPRSLIVFGGVSQYRPNQLLVLTSL